MAQRSVSIMAFPRHGNSYVDCFYRALEARGVAVTEGVFAGRWLLRNLRDMDYVHFHWPSFFYVDRSPVACLRKFALFLFLLALARQRGAQLLWTVHNLMPHDRCVVPGLDRLCRALLVRLCARFLVHGPAAEAEVLKRFPAMAGRILLVDHGHWVGHYPSTVTRAEARARLGLSEQDFVFGFVGLCKPYKNLLGLVEAFRRLPSRAVLLIAGRFQDAGYEAAVRAAVEAAGARIQLRAGFVPDDELQLYLRASDVMTAPYLEILTSGTAVLALSFGRPVVAPARGFLKDAIGADCGVLYDPAASDGLQKAMETAMTTTFDEARIIDRARLLDWDASARRLLAALPRPHDPVPARSPEPAP